MKMLPSAFRTDLRKAALRSEWVSLVLSAAKQSQCSMPRCYVNESVSSKQNSKLLEQCLGVMQGWQEVVVYCVQACRLCSAYASSGVVQPYVGACEAVGYLLSLVVINIVRIF